MEHKIETGTAGVVGTPSLVGARPKTPVNIIIGERALVKPEHSWCFIIGDQLTSECSYDVRITNVTLPVLDNTARYNLKTRLSENYESFYEESKKHGLAGEAWFESVKDAFFFLFQKLSISVLDTPLADLPPSNSFRKLLCCLVSCRKPLPLPGNLEASDVRKCDVKITHVPGLELIREDCACNSFWCSEECRVKSKSTHFQESLSGVCPRAAVFERASDSELVQAMNMAIKNVGGPVFWYPDTATKYGVTVTEDLRVGDIVCIFTLNPGDPSMSLGDDSLLWFGPIPSVSRKHQVFDYVVDPTFTVRSRRSIKDALEGGDNFFTSLADIKNILPYGTADPTNTTAVPLPAVKVRVNDNPQSTDFALVATRPIAKGEEVFFSRGFKYHLYRENDRGWTVPVGYQLPEYIFETPGFKAYINFTYPFASDVFVIRANAISMKPLPDDLFVIKVVIPAVRPSGPILTDFHPLGETPTVNPRDRIITFVVEDYKKYLFRS